MPRSAVRSRGPQALWLAVLSLLLPGCASIVSGQTQVVSVQPPGCEAARCELSNDMGKWFVSSTPGTVSVNRSYNNLQVLCRKDGIEAEPASFASTTKGSTPVSLILRAAITPAPQAPAAGPAGRIDRRCSGRCRPAVLASGRVWATAPQLL